MTMKSGRAFEDALNKITKSSHKPITDRHRISKAIAMLNLEPDLALKATNEIACAQDKYSKAVELLGHMCADKIKHVL